MQRCTLLKERSKIGYVVNEVPFERQERYNVTSSSK